MEPHSRKRNQRILNFLTKAAEAADHVGIRAKLAAAVVIKNEIIAIGFNRRKSHPFQAQYQTNDKQIYLHAETDAINRALKYITKEELKKAQPTLSKRQTKRVRIKTTFKNSFDNLKSGS